MSEAIAKSFNTTRSPGQAKTRTLVGNWYEDELWAENAKKENKSVAHSALLSSDKDFDPEGPPEAVKAVNRSSIGRRQQAIQEDMYRKAVQEVDSEFPDIPTVPSVNNNDTQTRRIGNQQGKKTHSLKNRHVDFIGNNEGSWETTNIMAASKKSGASNLEEDEESLGGSGVPYWQDTAVTLYADNDSVPGRTAGATLGKNSSFSLPIQYQ